MEINRHDRSSQAQRYYRTQPNRPQEVGAWNMAVEAFEIVSGSDVKNALDCLDDE